MFSNSADFQISGGSFYDVCSGDVNLYTHQHLTIQDLTLNHATLQAASPSVAALVIGDGWEPDGSGRELSGAVRHRHQITTAGPGPYDRSSRRHLSVSGPSDDDANPLPPVSTSPSPPSVGPSLTVVGPQSPPPHTNGPPCHADFSTCPKPDSSSLHPDRALSGITSSRDNPDPSSGRHPPRRFLPHPARFDGLPVQPVQGGTFITAQNVNHNNRPGERGLYMLHCAAALEALYDSAESFPQPKCHPETRTEMLNNLHNWAISSDSASSIFWLYGPAGAGKSAIMQTLCRRLQDGDRLGGSFFFKRAHSTRGNAKVLFVTIAHQLARNPVLKGPIAENVEADSTVLERTMDIQLQKLILEPCKSLQSPIEKPLIILIDGLDECESQHAQQEFLRLIGDAILNPRMIRIIIASRPEPHIREIFDQPSMKSLYHRLNIEQSFTDIEKYLRDEFSRIHRDHGDTMGAIPSPWPPQYILDLLVEKSSGYFIYASTVIKFINDKDFRPTERLADVVHWQNLPTDSDRPFEGLDQLYTQILCAVPARSRLVRILCALYNFPDTSSGEIECLLQLNLGDVGLSLRRLHSIFNVPSTGCISMYHASIRDFLSDPARSGEFCVNTSHQRMELARSVLKAISYTDHDSIHQLTARPKYIDGKLACRCIHYLNPSVPPTADLVPFIWSINPHFLFHHGTIFTADAMMLDMRHWLKRIEAKADSKDLVALWEDYVTLRSLDIDLKKDEYLTTREHEGLIDPVSFDMFSQFPRVLKVLQAWHICYAPGSEDDSPSLFSIRFLLDLSWNEMRGAFIRPLKQNRAQLKRFFAAAYLAKSCPTLYMELGRGCLRLLQKIDNGELPQQMLNGIRYRELIAKSCSNIVDI